MTWQDHYLETLGNVPDAITQMFDLDEELGEAYTRIRKRAYADGGDHLPLAYRELLFVVLDVVVGNYDGAMNHLRAAVAAGLKRQELADALLETFIVTGVSAWGKVGHRVWRDSAPLFEEDGQ